jgi:uncharacterized SAM-binding protein YcdF (DUF218 family)
VRGTAVGPVCGAVAGGLCGFLLGDLAPVEIASAWIPLAAAGALLGSTRLRALPLAGAIVLALAWNVVAWTSLASAMASALPRRDPLRSADAVLVMASRLQSDGDPTVEADSRLDRGVALLTAGLAARLIVPELAEPAPRYEPLARARLEQSRAEGVEVVAVGPVRRTRDEAVAVAALCRARGWGRVLVVTSPLHSRRACAALEREGLEVISAPAVETRFDLQTLDRPPERLQAFSGALYERAATWLYARRGWIRAE